ncbi:hypothetical protein BKK80_01350 [Cupriavidus malaysiensis]|uniref:DUF2489 domain-containing protein n=2 Tax=Cupriavidus malaysiensis TaxID=367825 RepID=A0ABN4TBV4_9BURK|nr:DUF2489 domain-containing protein [Cupriavidus malaysiensis]AOZ04637.1 hypothetical protein BKK80_01350 [Cupriavidus malaysiensis]
MDEKNEQVSAKRHELIVLANSMLAGELNLIEGVRQICALRFAVEDPENEVFLVIRGIDSETDTFPLGAMRANCSPEYLSRMDNEMQRYLSEAQVDILEACREIIKAFS